MSRGAIWLERLAIGVASLALSVGLIALLSGYFAGRDQAGIASSAGVPGQAVRDQGNAILRPGQARPAYDSDPPTSGAHLRVAVRRDLAPLSDDQLLTALALGDVVIAYGGRTPPDGLTNLADQTASPFSATLAQAGQAVVLTPRAGVSGLVGLAWAHILQVSSPADPELRNFVAYWLGRGAP